MSDTIRMFIGATPGGYDYESDAVLVHSARKFASLPIEFTFMRQAKSGPYSGWNGLRSGTTPFSAFRWSVPAMCGFSGRGIYVDSDFVFHADLAELWREDIPGVIVTKRPKPGGKIKTCCTLFDCAKAKGHIADLDGLKKMADPQGFYGNYFKERPELVSTYATGDWNAHEAFDLSNPRIKATHYTHLDSQLHLKHAIKRLKSQGKSHWYKGALKTHASVYPSAAGLQEHFDAMLAEAQAAGLTYDSFGYDSGIEIERRAFTYKFDRGGEALIA